MKASQRQFLVTVQGVPGYFATLSGGETTSETSKVWDGGKLQPDVISAPADTSNLVIGRPYDPDRDQRYIDQLTKQVGRLRRTITKQPTDPDLTPVGKPTTYPNALLVRVTPPESDAASSDASTWDMEWATSGPA